jgi:hypothetical protein
MKKYIAGMLIAAGVIVASAAPSWAFRSVQIATVTAQTTTGGQKTAAFTLKIRNTGSPFGADQSLVTWTGVDPETTNWKIADQFLLLNATVTDSGGGIKIYTDNTAPDANPRFIPPVPGTPNNQANFAAGLLNASTPTTSAPPLPMAWSIKANSRIIEGGDVNTGIGAADPQTGSGDAVFNNRFQWLNMTDEYNWAAGVDFNGDGDSNDPGDAAPLALDAPFVTMINKVGIHFGQADSEFGAHPDGANSFVYLEANFAGSDVQQLYRTTTLRVEAYVQ